VAAYLLHKIMMNLRNFNISTKATASFIIVALPILIIGAISVFELGRLTKPLESDIPALVQDISQKSRLDDLAQSIKYYDEVLTQSARNFAFTQDKQWETRYNENVPLLDEAIKSALELGDDQDKAYFKDIDASNLALIDLETQALNFVNDGKAKEAVAVLEGKVYWEQKAIYKEGLAKYIDRRDQEKHESIGASLDALTTLSQATKNSYGGYVILLISISLGAFVLAIALGGTLAHYMSKRLSALKEAANAIAEGQYSERIQTTYADEIGQLGKAFNTMAEQIDKNQSTLEEQVKKRTEALEQSEIIIKKTLADAERANKLMVGRELEMVKLKKQLSEKTKKEQPQIHE